jgi:hypothetical protein
LHPKPVLQKNFNAKKLFKSAITDANETEKNSGMNGPSTVILNFVAMKAGSYNGKMIIYSTENVHDVRVLELKVHTTTPTADLILLFKGPARQELVQVLYMCVVLGTEYHPFSLIATEDVTLLNRHLIFLMLPPPYRTSLC